MSDKLDVAVGELLREIDDWQYGRSKPTMGLDEAHSLLRRCRAYFLSALPAEPKPLTLDDEKRLYPALFPAEPKQDCRAFYGKGRGLCDKCAAGHYEQCRYVAAEPKINAHASTAEKSSAPLQEGVGQGEHGHRKWPGECFWADCNKEAIYCEGHAREFVDPLGRLAAPPAAEQKKHTGDSSCGSVGGPAGPRESAEDDFQIRALGDFTLPYWWDHFVRNLGEIPYQFSPDDQPDAYVATDEQLENCALRAMESAYNECDCQGLSHDRECPLWELPI